METQKKISVAKCARVSYLTHDGTRDFSKDLELYDRLVSAGHMSPTEHVATPMSVLVGDIYSGNFRGWLQYRKILCGEIRTKYPSCREVEEFLFGDK